VEAARREHCECFHEQCGLGPDCASGGKRTDTQCVFLARKHPGKSRWNQIPEFSPHEVRIYAVFFNTSGVEKVSFQFTMDVTMDIGVRNLRFRAVFVPFFSNKLPLNMLRNAKSKNTNMSQVSFQKGISFMNANPMRVGQGKTSSSGCCECLNA